MKFNKLILGLVLGLGLAGIAKADDVYITGSTAMRGSIYNALMWTNCVFTNSAQFTGDGAGLAAGKSGASAQAADNYMNFTGTLVNNGSTVTTIHCHWTGSEAGILDVCSNNVVQEQFITQTDGSDQLSNTNTLSALVNVDICLADNAQAYSKTKSPTLVNTKIGVIPFEWVRNNGNWSAGSSASITNVTDTAIQAALSGGTALAAFTGNAADTTFCYVMGRDNLSGTRVNALADCGYGIFTPVQQIQVTGGAMVDQGGGVYKGEYGYAGGSSLAAAMAGSTATANDPIQSTTGQGFSTISYLGIGDAATAYGQTGCKLLTYNGVPFTRTNVLQGLYTFWGYEYVMVSPAAVTANASAYKAYNRIKLLANAATGTYAGWAGIFDGTKAIHTQDMAASRQSPIAAVTHN